MRIAQIAPLFEAVPPKLYGGTERVVSWLTEELVAMGHDVTLFASGDSVTSATLDAVWPQAIRLDPVIKDWCAAYAVMIEKVARRAHEFDVLHFHVDYFPLSVLTRLGVPFLTTLHGRLDLPEFQAVYETFPSAPFVSISDSQRAPLPNQNWIGTVLHGMPPGLLTPQPVKQEYLAFLGRVSPEKGLDRAIRIAERYGMKLKIAAKVDRADQEYYDTTIKPLIAAGSVDYIGEINDAQKPAFLSGARNRPSGAAGGGVLGAQLGVGRALVARWLEGVASFLLPLKDAWVILVHLDEVFQVLDAVPCERHHPVLANSVNPQLAVFSVHLTRDIEEPILVLAEHLGDMAEGKHGADLVDVHDLRRPSDGKRERAFCSTSRAKARRAGGTVNRRCGPARRPAKLAGRYRSVCR
jgi:glycosyltransferase involved in cell wall biosynthesis